MTERPQQWFAADWPAPDNVVTLISFRAGGQSSGCYASNNLAFHVGDDPAAVNANRQRLQAGLGGARAVQWLQQVHGTVIVDANPDGEAQQEADGCMTVDPGVACAVMTADCLPVLLCDSAGKQVAAIHAGWRGLNDGILLSAIRRFAVARGDLLVYLGPAISQLHFEVGPEVVEAFSSGPAAQALGEPYTTEVRGCFLQAEGNRYLADLYEIARWQCLAMGVTAVFGGNYCTYRDANLFYSYRRDGHTGRMASLIWLRE